MTRRPVGATLLSAALALTLAAAPAWAKIEVHVVNCTAAGLHAAADNGKDASEAVPASSKEFHEADPG